MARRTPSQLNMLLAVDKPVGCTSHDVVSQCRRALHERRIGHAGTLDPMASGVMVVGVGQATRLLGMLTLDTKSYVADISFGVETNTDDAEGEAVRTVPVAPELHDLAYARKQLAAMLGPQMQVPPAFSAISVNGVRAYKSAREGNAVDLPPRPVEVYAADLIAVSGEGDTCVWTVAFSVSKGTYIRALARDLGRACDSAAHISALRRTASGVVSIGACHAVEELSAESAAGFALDPIAALGATRVDLPGNLADDLLFIKELDPQMVGIGPFVPHHDTRFKEFPSGSVELTTYLVSILRLMNPHLLLPSTTALGTIDPRGREKGILAGANVVMPNLSPVAVRKDYSLYDNKICTGEEAAECAGCLGRRLASIDYQLVFSRGDYIE